MTIPLINPHPNHRQFICHRAEQRAANCEVLRWGSEIPRRTFPTPNCPSLRPAKSSGCWHIAPPFPPLRIGASAPGLHGTRGLQSPRPRGSACLQFSANPPEYEVRRSKKKNPSRKLTLHFLNAFSASFNPLSSGGARALAVGCAALT